MRVAASPSFDMVPTVRRASLTAREATSVERWAWPAISPIEAASSSTEEAAEVTLPEAEPTRRSAVRASLETVSAASLSSLEVFSSRSAASRTRESAWSTDISKRVMVAAITSPRFSRSRLAAAWLWASRSRSIMVSRKTMTVRAMAPSSSRDLVAGIGAEVSPVARRVMACARPLSGRVMLRPISQLNARPINTAPQPTRMIAWRVHSCDATSVTAASSARARADEMILSASGSISSLERSMFVTQGRTRDAASAHSENVST